MRPKISVIVPVYNAAQTLSPCLSSILASSFRDFEVICVNDGSTDESASLLEGFARNDHRIQIISQTNQGGGAARNAGMLAAKGEYLVFWDSDDLFDLHALQVLSEKCDRDKLDLCIFSGWLFHHETQDSIVWQALIKPEHLPAKSLFSGQDIPDHIFQITTPQPWNKMFRREAIKQWGIFFQPIKKADDLRFVYMALALAQRIAVLNRPFVYYRVYGMQRAKGLCCFDFIEALDSLKSELQQRDLYARYQRSYVNLELRQFVWVLESVMHLPQLLNRHNRRMIRSLYKAFRLRADKWTQAGYARDFYYRQDDFCEMRKCVHKPWIVYLAEFICRSCWRYANRYASKAKKALA